MTKKINIVCIKWGTIYSPDYVNRLYSMIKRNTSYDINFYCFTDDGSNLNEDIVVKPMPELNTPADYKEQYQIYRKGAGLCDDNLGGLTNERVFFFDLDMLIISNLDAIFDYPKDDKVYIINDWNSKGNIVGQSSCYSWVVGTLGYVKDYYEKNPKKVTDRFYTSSQQYLSSKIIEKYGKLDFWPENWFCSFRFHCMRSIPLRYFLQPKIPTDRPDLKVIVFHGTPNPSEARDGIWPLKGRDKKWKRLYKFCKPTKWIDKYWN